MLGKRSCDDITVRNTNKHTQQCLSLEGKSGDGLHFFAFLRAGFLPHIVSLVLICDHLPHFPSQMLLLQQSRSLFVSHASRRVVATAAATAAQPPQFKKVCRNASTSGPSSPGSASTNTGRLIPAHQQRSFRWFVTLGSAAAAAAAAAAAVAGGATVLNREDTDASSSSTASTVHRKPFSTAMAHCHEGGAEPARAHISRLMLPGMKRKRRG